MSSSQRDFIINALRDFTGKAVVAVGLDIVANLREDTPRDTGWARANWIGSKGRDNPGLANPEGRPSSADVVAARAASAAGEAEIISYGLEDGPLFISNNVPYIQQLNSGSSRQAGAAFVERAIERGVRTGLQNAARRLR